MKVCPICNNSVDDNATFCTSCGISFVNTQEYVAQSQYQQPIQYEQTQQVHYQQPAVMQQNYFQANNVQSPENQMSTSPDFQQGKTKKGFTSKNGKTSFNFGRFFGGIVFALIVAIVIGIVDNNTTDKLMGTWTYTQSVAFDETYSFDVAINLDLEKNSYRWYIDEEKTRDNMDKVYDSVIDSYEITESDVIGDGYSSMEEFKQACIDEDIVAIVSEFNSETQSGTWHIEKSEFLFTETGTTTEYRTIYELDGDTLILKTDEITLTKVK